MMILALLFLVIGLILVSLGTWLSPYIALKVYKSKKFKAKLEQFKETDNVRPENNFQNVSLDILIPAHKEFVSLPVSLNYFNNLNLSKPDFFTEIKTHVALSNWEGEEAVQASRTASAVISVRTPGKWFALKELVYKSQADWVALVDSGTIWSEDCLAILAKYIKEQDVVVVNPTYSEQGRVQFSGKGLQHKIWKIESFIKNIENQCGGPISLHGSTIIYKREYLIKALDKLGDVQWLNDDVVVPLMVRSLYPDKKIIYTSEIIALDQFPASLDQSEVNRRKRLLLGNIQWVKAFFGYLCKDNQVLAFLALRRVSRMVWAWWGIFLGLSLFSVAWSFNLHTSFAAVMVVGILVAYTLKSTRRIMEAFWISLCMPFYYLRYKEINSETLWK